MLLIDRVSEVEEGRKVVAIKNITCNEPCYAELADGSGTELHAYPASLMVESFSQSAGILLFDLWKTKQHAEENIIMFGSMANVTFHRDVGPGDTLQHHVWLDFGAEDSAIISGKVMVGEEEVMSVERIAAVLRPRRQVFPPSGGKSGR
jgi:3-hydroxyacyl-[acyl-carrier-protein] dehydratase